MGQEAKSTDEADRKVGADWDVGVVCAGGDRWSAGRGRAGEFADGDAGSQLDATADGDAGAELNATADGCADGDAHGR